MRYQLGYTPAGPSHAENNTEQLESKMDTLAKREEAYKCMLQVKFDFRLKFF